MAKNQVKSPIKERFFPPFPEMAKSSAKNYVPNEDDDMITDTFGSMLEGELDITHNVVYVLPIEYDTVTYVTEEEGDCIVEEISSHKPLCYYIMNAGCMEEDKAYF